MAALHFFGRQQPIKIPQSAIALRDRESKFRWQAFQTSGESARTGGRDLFREPAPDGGSFALCYDNGFEAATDNRVLFFDERRVTGIYDIADIQRSRPLAPTAGTEALERQIRAFIQQYYSHIEHKAFTVE